MQNTKVLKAILIISGLIVMAVGASLLLTPVAMYQSVDTDISGMTNLLSDLRATGSSLLILGILIVLGAFIPRLTYTATLVACILFLSYGTARIYSIVVDGMPAELLVQVTILELVVGVVCLAAWLRYRTTEST